MIGKLTGKIDELKPTEIILDVNGVGYLVSIPISTFNAINDKEKISLYIHTIHKEDTFRLFGFNTPEEKDFFKILIAINGIGPSMGLSILSGISLESLLEAVTQEDTTNLVKIPGIGKTKAEKIIFELKRKKTKLSEITGTITPREQTDYDAIGAMISLGFDEKKSTEIITKITSEKKLMTTEEIIKEALKNI